MKIKNKMKKEKKSKIYSDLNLETIAISIAAIVLTASSTCLTATSTCNRYGMEKAYKNKVEYVQNIDLGSKEYSRSIDSKVSSK